LAKAPGCNGKGGENSLSASTTHIFHVTPNNTLTTKRFAEVLSAAWIHSHCPIKNSMQNASYYFVIIISLQ